MRRLEHADEDKFWEAWIKDDTIFMYRFGKNGTQGQTRLKRHASKAEAEADLEENVQRKLGEGFKEKGAKDDGEEQDDSDDEKESDEDEAEDSDEDDEDDEGDDDDEASKKKKRPAKHAEVAAAASAPTPPKKVATITAAPKPEQISAARNALEALRTGLGGRSWKVRRLGRKARHALERIPGSDPAKLGFGDVFDGVMHEVVAPKKALPLEIAIELLIELDPTVFVRTVKQWKGSAAGTAKEAIGVLATSTEAIHDADVALRVGAALAERHLDAASWRKRFHHVKPELEEALKKNSSTLTRYLKSLDAADDTILASRVEEAAR